MKRVLFLAGVAVCTLAVAAPSSAATSASQQQRQVRLLQRQVKLLQRQTKTLQRQVKTLQTQMREVRGVAALGAVFGGCTAAVTADTFQGTWRAIDDLATKVAQPTYFGAQAPLNDFGLCAILEIQRAPTQFPPNTAVFNSLLTIFQ